MNVIVIETEIRHKVYSYHHLPVLKGIFQIKVLNLLILPAGKGNLRQTGHGDGAGGETLYIVQIDEIGTVGAQKVSEGVQLATQIIQTADALQNLSAVQMKEQRPVYHLAVFQLPELDPRRCRFRPA